MSIFRSETASSAFASVVSQDCTLCGVRARESLCTDCHNDLPVRTTSGCPRCDVEGNSQQECGACLADPPYFDETISAFYYAYPLDRLVQAYKFNAHLSLLPLLADGLIGAIVRHGSTGARPDLVIPLPLAPRRLAERGFNQSSLVAERVASTLGIRFEARGMLRVRETPPQSGLSRQARLKNVRGAFDCSKRLDGMRVAVIDDVMTTGATLSEAAKALKKAGAAFVSAWVIARAAKDETGTGAAASAVPFDDVQER